MRPWLRWTLIVLGVIASIITAVAYEVAGNFVSKWIEEARKGGKIDTPEPPAPDEPTPTTPLTPLPTTPWPPIPPLRLDFAYAGIEVSTKAVTTVVLDVGADGVGEILPSTNEQVSLATGDKNIIDKTRIDTTAEVIAHRFHKLREVGVPASHIFMMGSSSLCEAANRDELASTVLDRTGCQLEFIDKSGELPLNIKALVPGKFRDDSIFIDLGSGSTRMGYLHEADGLHAAGFQANRRKLIGVKAATAALGNDADFDAALNKFRGTLEFETDVFPGFVNRPNVYLMGGVAWALATVRHPRECENVYVMITRDDVVAFMKFANDVRRNNYPEQPDWSQEDLAGDGLEKSLDEYRKVKSRIGREDLFAGACLLNELFTTLNLGAKHKSVRFPRRGLFACLEGFVRDNAAKRKQP